MIVWAPAERPVVVALVLLDPQVVDAGDAQTHQAVLVEFPVLVAETAKPGSVVVVALVGEAHGDAVLADGPDFLDQPVVQLALPLARQECHDRFAALKERSAIAPAAVARLGKRDALRIGRVPRVLGHPRFLSGCFGSERW
jgi:hypothetical protein